jgi:hypothetical protein
LAHQFLGQLPDHLRQAVLGNAANFVALRVGAEDAPLLANHLALAPELEFNGTGTREISAANKLINQPKYHAYARIPDDPSLAGPIPLDLLPPPQIINRHPDRLVSRCRSRFGRDRGNVEEKIARFLAPTPRPERNKLKRSKRGNTHALRSISIDRGAKLPTKPL